MSKDPLLNLLKRPTLWVPPLVLVALMAAILHFFTILVVYVFLGLILSLLARPLYDQIEKIRIGKKQIGASLNAFISVFSVLIIIGLSLLITLPAVLVQLRHLSDVEPQALMQTLNTPLLNLENWLISKGLMQVSTEQESQIANRLIAFTEDWLRSESWYQWLSPVLSAFSSTIAAFFAIPFSAFFILRDRRKFIRFFLSLLPPGLKNPVLEIFVQTRQLLSRYFFGIILEIAAVAIMTGAGLWIVGLNFTLALTLGCISGLFNIIPYLGPILGSAAGILLALTAHVEQPFDTFLMPLFIKMGIVYLIVQVLDGLFIQPWLYSGSVSAHPLEIFLIILAGGHVAGIPGMMLAVPVYTLIRLSGVQLFKTLQLLYRSSRENAA